MYSVYPSASVGAGRLAPRRLQRTKQEYSGARWRLLRAAAGAAEGAGAVRLSIRYCGEVGASSRRARTFSGSSRQGGMAAAIRGVPATSRGKQGVRPGEDGGQRRRRLFCVRPCGPPSDDLAPSTRGGLPFLLARLHCFVLLDALSQSRPASSPFSSLTRSDRSRTHSRGEYFLPWSGSRQQPALEDGST